MPAASDFALNAAVDPSGYTIIPRRDRAMSEQSALVGSRFKRSRRDRSERRRGLSTSSRPPRISGYAARNGETIARETEAWWARW